MNWRDALFTRSLSLASRATTVRDRLVRVTRRYPLPADAAAFRLPSGTRKLDAVFAPARNERAALLLCHGIGETVPDWTGVQGWFADRGVATLVFNYSGFGRSTGSVSPAHCHEDTLNAFAALRQRIAPATPVFVLGYSLGGGIATQAALVLGREIAGLLLCDTFTSFREAARCAGVPSWLAHILAPEVWGTASAIAKLSVPVTLLRSDGDRLFPATMIHALHTASLGRAEFLIIPGLTHGEAFRKVDPAFWNAVLERLTPRAGENILP